MLSLDYGTGGGDGVQLTRSLRAWEMEGNVGTKPIKIIGMSKLREFIGSPDQRDLISAGVDSFLWQPDTDYIPASEKADLVMIGSIATTKEAVAITQQKDKYTTFADVAVKIMVEEYRDSNITAIWDDPSKMLSADILASLPGATVGPKIRIEGTLPQVNEAMRGVFFYAPSNTNGNVSMTTTVADHPAACRGYDGLLPTSPQRFVQKPSLAILPATDNYGAFGNTSNIADAFCDKNQSTLATSHISIFVIAVNQAPYLTLSESSFTSQVNLDTPVPTFVVEDEDHLELLLQTSLGEESQPSITVTMTTMAGRLSLLYKDDIVFIIGRGRDDRAMTFRGPLDKVNKAVQSASYICLVADGCMGGYIDSINILVDDEGFRGKGGALTFSASISVNISQ